MTRTLALRAASLACALELSACQVAPVRAPAEAAPAAPATSAPVAAPPTVETPRKKPKKPRKPKAPAVAESAALPTQPMRGADVFERLVARFADAPCVQDRVVQRWERLYTGNPKRLSANLAAVLPMLALVLDEIEMHGLPAEFALLPVVESWYRPDASHAGAAGMWQFTAPTARINGLRIVPGYDERLAPQAATRAAMRYLGLLYNRFGDWKLANMAYNAGDYRLLRAIARRENITASASAHQPPGLSMTTYEHLAKVQALACIVAQPSRFRLDLPLATVVEPLRVAHLPAHATSLDAVARNAGIDAAHLRALNPAFAQGRIVGNARREVLMPLSALERFAAPRLASNDDAPPPRNATDEADAPRSYVIRSGDTLGAIAQRFGVALKDLLRWNGLDLRAVVHPGHSLRLED